MSTLITSLPSLVEALTTERDAITEYRAQCLANAKEIQALKVERDACKQQAQIWKMEAETYKSTVHECYQACTGATGEPGSWHGASPVLELVKERDSLKQALESAANYIDVLGGVSKAYRMELANYTKHEESTKPLPLTEIVIKRLLEDNNLHFGKYAVRLIRAVEEAHGIKEQP